MTRTAAKVLLPTPGRRGGALDPAVCRFGCADTDLFVADTYAWDTTNSPDYCGTSCHTMPPKFTSDLVSPHARVQCVECHFPEKFSDDSLREIVQYGDDTDNTPRSICLTLKTGGGSEREGLGRGIHWHVENEGFYLTDDPAEQVIPYVLFRDDNGSEEPFVDLATELDPVSVDSETLQRMVCITCHNRISHMVFPPQTASIS